MEEQQSPEQNKLQIKTALIIFITLIAFFLMFGILNYFNLFPISDIFPRQLGWLPRRIQQQNIIPSPENFTPNTNPNTFTYDSEKAKTILTQYMRSTIKSELLPTNIEVKQGLTIDGRTEDIKSEFGSIFTANNSTISANFHYKEGANVPNDYVIFIQAENLVQTNVTASQANSLLTFYFKNPNTTSSCQTKRNGYYCENFQTVAEGKNGYGILIGNDQGKIRSIIFTCLIPEESKDYVSFKSCLAQ